MNTVPIRFRDVHDVGTARHAGVVDEDIDATKLGHGVCDHAANVADATDVGRNRHGAALAGGERAHHLVGLVTVNIDRDDDGPGLGKCPGGGRTDAATGTGHHRHAILEHHDTSPP